MHGILHPFSKALYEQDGDDRVRVTTTDGRVGHFRRDGSRIDGDVYDVDPQLCGWVGGPRAVNRLQKAPKVS